MDVLLTFTGFHDPYTPGLVAGTEQPGPILSLLSNRRFDRVVLFSTPHVEAHTERTAQPLATQFPGVGVEVRHLPLYDPTDYRAILANLRAHGTQLLERHRG